MNSPLYKFIVTAIAIFVLWYLVYEMWLLPEGSLDQWVSLNTIGIAGGVLKKLGFDVYTVNRIIGIGENAGVEVLNGCNGLSSMGLFIGFVAAYPGVWYNKVSFSILGVGVIYIVNILRITSLVLIQAKYPEYFDFMHEYSTSALFYLIIFLLWMIWVKTNDNFILRL